MDELSKESLTAPRLAARLSMRFYAALLVWLTALPFAGWIILNGFTAIKNEESIALRYLENRALEDGRDVGRWVAQVRSFLEAVAQDDEIRRLECPAWTNGFIKASPDFSSLRMFTISGELICNPEKVERKLRSPDEIRATPFFAKMAQTDDFVASKVTYGGPNHTSLIVMGQPFKGPNGETAGYVVAVLDLVRVARLMFEGRPSEPIINVIDENAQRLLRWPDPEKWVGTPLKPAENLTLTRNGLVHSGTASRLGADLLAARAAIPSLNWTISAYVARDSVVSKVRSKAIQLALILALMVLFLTAASYFASNLIVRPVTALAKISRGDSLAIIPDELRSTRVPSEVADVVGGLLRLNKSLAESQARYKEIIESSPQPCSVYELGEMTFVNSAFVKTFGYDLKDVPTKEDWYRKAYPEPVLQEERRQKSIDAFVIAARALRDGKNATVLTSQEPVKVITKDGRELFFLIYLTALSADVQRVLMSYADVTDLELARHALRKSELFSRQVIEASPIPCLVHSEGRTELVNSAFTRVFGYEFADLPTVEQWREKAYPDPKVRQRVMEIVATAVDDTKNKSTKDIPRFVRFEAEGSIKIRAKDGREITALGYMTMFGDSDPRTLLSFVDVTERTELQERLQQADKMAAIGQLTGGVAHDVNNNLAVIMGSAELIHEAAPKGSRTAELTKRILKSGRRSAELVGRLMIVARKAEVEPSDIELPLVVSDMIETLKRTLGGKIAIRFTPPQGSCLVRVDRVLLESSLINLSVNARDAMPEGGTLSFGISIEPATEADGTEWVALSVTDTGIGMTEDVCKRVFDAFFTTKAPGAGTGLGLAMVQGFVEQSGGKIAVVSTPGAGSTFTLRFPKVQSPDGNSALLEVKEHMASGTGHLVLLVDDNNSVRKTLREQLETIGCRVIEAETCEFAQLRLKGTPGITFVLSDLDLGPGASGLDLAEWAVREGYRIPGAIITGYLNIPINRIAATGWTKLQKPVNIKSIRAALNEARRPKLSDLTNT